jgi:hypothetical protein
MLSYEAAIQQWREGERRLDRAERAEARVLERVTQRIYDELRRRLGGAFTVDELIGLYSEGTAWAEALAKRTAPADPWAWDARTVVDAAFARYLREASGHRLVRRERQRRSRHSVAAVRDQGRNVLELRRVPVRVHGHRARVDVVVAAEIGPRVLARRAQPRPALHDRLGQVRRCRVLAGDRQLSLAEALLVGPAGDAGGGRVRRRLEEHHAVARGAEPALLHLLRQPCAGLVVGDRHLPVGEARVEAVELREQG